MSERFIQEWLKGKTAEDFDVIEHQGRVLWPYKLSRLTADAAKGKSEREETDVFLRTLDTYDIGRAGLAAQKLFAALGFNVEKDRSAHEEIWDELIVYARFCYAVRAADGSQMFTPDNLIPSGDGGSNAARIPRHAIFDVQRQLYLLGGFEDSRLEEMSVDEVIGAARAIARVRNLSPLVALGGALQDTFVIILAQQLVMYLDHKSSLLSQDSSTPESTPKKT